MVKWWHGGTLSSCKDWWKSNDAHRRESTVQSVMFFTFLFGNNARQITVADDLVALFQQEIASVFVHRFRCSLQFLSGKKSPFQHREQIWNSLLGGATIGARLPRKIFKIWENGCKDCARHFDHLKASSKKNSTIPFYLICCRCPPV